MKKLFITMLAVAIVVCVLTATAAASNYENCADKLYELGLLQGTDNGFDLDAVPTRVQAVVMLVRLLGLEEDALNGGYEHPFNDVPAWADPYVGYAYESGLANGVGDGLFGADDACSAQMYVTFVLRALGYNDAAGDFSYADAVEFGMNTGIIDANLAGGDFLRDHMAAVSYLALAAAPGDGEFATLLDKLSADGAVPAEAAKSVLKDFELHNEFETLNASFSELERVEMDISSSTSMSIMGAEQAVEMSGNIKFSMEDGDIVFAALIDSGGVEMECYYQDGWFYAEADGEKMKMEMAAPEALSQIGTVEISPNPLYIIDTIEKSSEGELTVYTVELDKGAVDALLSQGGIASSVSGLTDILGDSEFAITINSYIMKVYIDSDGMLKKMTMVYDMDMSMNVEGVQLDISTVADIEVEIVATGDGVEIVLPDDLSDYVDLSEMMVTAA